jgi:hypothetical protein
MKALHSRWDDIHESFACILQNSLQPNDLCRVHVFLCASHRRKSYGLTTSPAAANFVTV